MYIRTHLEIFLQSFMEFFFIARAIKLNHARDFHFRYFYFDDAWVKFLLINLLIDVSIF